MSEAARRASALKLIVLDRDGTINIDRDDYVKAPEEWEPIEGSLEAIARLNHNGWHVVVATNQSGLARGLFDMAALTAIHQKMNTMLARHGGRVDAVFFCPHAPEDGCDCRKPQPGLVAQIVHRYGLHAAQVPVVGDSLRDLLAGIAAGCPTHLVRTGKTEGLDEAALAKLVAQAPGTMVHADLAAVAEHLLGGGQG